MKQTLRQTVSQRLTMTPALQQAIRMLQLSTLDLKTEIRDALESNVMLEAEEVEPVDTAPGATDDATTSTAIENGLEHGDIPEKLPLDADWNDIYANDSYSAPSRGSGGDEDWRSYQQNNLTATPDLHAHLSWQADMHPFTPLQREAASHIIDAIDDNGFVTDWSELGAHLAQALDLNAHDCETVLAAIQSFDPTGVGARNVAECLAIQLRQIDSNTEGYQLALTLVENDWLEALAHGRPETLARRLEITGDELARARALLQTLQPHPGTDYAESQADYVIPEVFVVRQQSRWRALLNPDIAPRLRINNDYLGLMKNGCNSADRATLQTHLQEARALLHSLRSRNETLLLVAQCIVDAQHGFLDYGEEAMKPLVLRDVSRQLNIHESTVSRATANKFMQTPRGILELKYFFSSHVSTTDGGLASATAIQAMIKRLIGKEDPTKPVSDSKLATTLQADAGIEVARRTVAKYREELAIPPSHQRRRKPT